MTRAMSSARRLISFYE
ncbi:hypothetical protein CLS_28490 [[Clostridium] cf. saccharolyticum K10]|nr:hypothetical protein CLS_28490 [[Clostridium] cf. saccharolyticum K10]